MINSTFPQGLRTKQITGGLIIQQRRRLLLADQPGAGKTAQALLALELDQTFSRESVTLITTTLTACQLTWASELSERLASQHDILLCDLTSTGKHKRTGQPKKTMPTLAQRNTQLEHAVVEAHDLGLPLVVLANFEMLRWIHTSPPKVPALWDLIIDNIIIDESHLVLPTKDDARETVSQFWYGLLNLRFSANPIKLAMSGTPDRGKLENRYGTWKFFHPTQYTDFWSWCESQFVLTYEEWGGITVGKQRHPEQWAQTDQRLMLRRTKAEMLEGLPEKQWAGNGGIDLPMTAEQVVEYDAYMDTLKDLEADLIERAGEQQTPHQVKLANRAKAMKLTFGLRSQQMATCTWDFFTAENPDGGTMTTGIPRVAGPSHSNKLAWLLDFLEERGHLTTNWDESLGKVVIVSFFTQVLKWLKAELAAADVDCEILSGETSGVDKQRIEARFQRGDLRIVLLSGYLGVSINLDAADDMVFIEPNADPDKLEQAEDRIHRASRNHVCTYWRLVSKGTSDVVVLGTADTRYRDTRRSYDGDRGVQFARKMLERTHS